MTNKTGFRELSTFLKVVVVFVCVQIFFVALTFALGFYNGMAT